MKIGKSYFCCFFLACLAVAVFAKPRIAAARIGSGSCGSNASWKYDTQTRTLELTGTGIVEKAIHIKKRMHRRRKGFNVQKLIIHEGITGLKDGIFENVLSGFSEVSLPHSFQKITIGMFEKSMGLETLYIPENVMLIEKPAFWQAQALKEITVSPSNRHYRSVDGVLYTKDFSELVCYPQIKKGGFFHVPDSVTKIAPLAFAGNSSLKKVKLPAGLEELGGGAFYGCSSLKTINSSELCHLKRIKDYASAKSGITGYAEESENEYDFNGHSSDGSDSTADTLKTEHLGTFSHTLLTSFDMPDSLRYMASETFRHTAIRRLTIGKNFTGGINNGKEFTQKSVNLYYAKLKKIAVNPGNKAYKMDENILYTKDGRTLCYVISDRKYHKRTLIIPAQVKEIAHGAFHSIDLYKNIVAEGSLDKIGVSAFAGSRISSFRVKGTISRMMMGAFTKSTVKNWEYSGGLTFIPANAFIGSGLEQFDLHSEVTEIGNNAFQNCVCLREVTNADSVKKLGNNAFAFCTSLTNLELVNLESTAGWPFAGVAGYIIPEAVFSRQQTEESINDSRRDWLEGRALVIPSEQTLKKYEEICFSVLTVFLYAWFMVQASL